MQIALTKKLAKVMGVTPTPADTSIDTLFSWTANWINTFDRRKEDMVVMVNNATRFTVIIYGVKSRQFRNISAKMQAAIRNTLLAINLNPEIVEEYMQMCGDIVFVSNSDSKMTAWMNRQGLEAAYIVGRTVNESMVDIKYNDTLGYIISDSFVNFSKSSKDAYVPLERMVEVLAGLAGKPAYKHRALELLVTLDLEIYKCIRRLIVPADIAFADLHKVLQQVFDWQNCHLHDFKVIDKSMNKVAYRIVMCEEDLVFDKDGILEESKRLSDYFPQYSLIRYTYDFGDSWLHDIELVRVIEERNEESPYLLEAIGQTPPEDVGGVDGFINFRNIMQNPTHPDYAMLREWAGFWSLELSNWNSRPRIVRC